MLVRTQTLSPDERILIDRRRRGETQIEAASRLGLTTNAFRALETGEKYAGKSLRPPLGRLADYEQCLIARKRYDLTMQEVADDIEISRWWVVQIEAGRAPADCLVDYWTLD